MSNEIFLKIPMPLLGAMIDECHLQSREDYEYGVILTQLQRIWRYRIHSDPAGKKESALLFAGILADTTTLPLLERQDGH